uniref:Replicative helicase inhibitor G39P N-terminal domain-containing protein n=1 Tax=viral metagenome TaxID=1070528 RepID=A0A6M3M511_9ZZZZ
MNRKEFTDRLFVLALVLDHDMTQKKADAYWEIFKDYPDKELIRAINVSLKTSKFFPKPVELIGIIEGVSTGSELYDRYKAEREAQRAIERTNQLLAEREQWKKDSIVSPTKLIKALKEGKSLDEFKRTLPKPNPTT